MALRDTTKGKLIYQPQGPAGEYAKWSVNLHNGCTHGCTYCYNRRGVLSHAFGEEPKLAAPIVRKAKGIMRQWHSDHKFIHPNNYPPMSYFESQAVMTIISEDIEKIGHKELENHGVFLSFKCDPMDANNRDLTRYAVLALLREAVPVTILTKNTGWLYNPKWCEFLDMYPDYGDETLAPLTIGFTLTGMDDMEVNAPSTKERLEALRKVHTMGIKTFVSLEPVIDVTKAIDVLHDCLPYSNEIRIGLQSPYKKDRYTRSDIIRLLSVVQPMQTLCPNVNIVLKDSVYRQCEAFGLKI